MAPLANSPTKPRSRRVRTAMLKVSGPFSLPAAVAALDELSPLPERHAPGTYVGWHWIDHRPLLVRVTPAGPRRLALSVEGDYVDRADVTAAEAIVRRMFGLDLDAERFYAEAGRDDRVLRRLQTRLFGVRPIAAPTPLSALVALLLRDECGPDRARLVLGRLGRDAKGHWLPPEPADLLGLDPTSDAPRLGVEPATVARLSRLGERGLTGAFGSELLRSMPADAARKWLCDQAEVTGATAELALLAGAGRRDVAPQASPELLAALEHFYGTPRGEARVRLAELIRRWGEFAAWAAYLLVEAARRDGMVVTAPATT